MATRNYWAAFGGGSLGAKSGLAPTFITFINTSGSGIVSPAITEPGSKGLYTFAYDATQTIAFVLDGATTGLAASDRYVSGVLDPYDTFGVTLNAISATQAAQSTLMANMGATLTAGGVTLAAIGSSLSGIGSLIGSTASSFGSTSVDPVDLFGFLMRAQEFMEGNQTYAKSTGILDFYSRGSSTLLIEKTITDDSTSTTKT